MVTGRNCELELAEILCLTNNIKVDIINSVVWNNMH